MQSIMFLEFSKVVSSPGQHEDRHSGALRGVFFSFQVLVQLSGALLHFYNGSVEVRIVVLHNKELELS